MSMFLLLAIGCPNVAQPDWAGGGARYASGYASDGDTASDTGAGVSDGSPEISEGPCAYDDGEVAGQIYIVCAIPVEDSNDDVLGGHVYLTLFGNDERLAEESRLVVEEDANANTEALLANGILAFSVGPVVEGVTHEVVLYVNDFTHNSSNEITVPVTGG